MGSIQFAVSFQEMYGIVHPDFFPGTLEQAYKEASFKPAKDVRIYIKYFYTLLFHSLFKVEFDIDHFVLGEHWER